MEKSSRQLLIQKNKEHNWRISLFSHIFTCMKCKKYNSIMVNNETHDNDTKSTANKKNAFQNCQFCTTPNYVYKK
jgi:anthranilate/para-aminobenzoate synthase component II